MRVRLATPLTENGLGKADLEPLRNVRGGSAAAELARKLYYHAHNKIAELSGPAAEYLDRFFSAGDGRR